MLTQISEKWFTSKNQHSIGTHSHSEIGIFNLPQCMPTVRPHRICKQPCQDALLSRNLISSHDVRCHGAKDIRGSGEQEMASTPE